MVEDNRNVEPHTIHLGGRMTAADRAELVLAARGMLAAKRGGVVDVAGLEAWDLGTFQILLALRRDVSATGEQVRLEGLRADADAVLRALGLSDAMANALAWEVW